MRTKQSGKSAGDSGDHASTRKLAGKNAIESGTGKDVVGCSHDSTTRCSVDCSYLRYARASSRESKKGHHAAARKKGVKEAMATIKMGDKLYLVTRRDIAPGYQAVQSCHAMRQFTADHPERDKEWFTNSNYLALLSVEDEVELMRLLTAAKDNGIKWSAFREPDVGGQITAIALEPHAKTVELCKSFPLALKELV